MIEESLREEEELIARARRGDTHAFGELVTLHSRIAFRTAYVITSSAADAEDVTQEAFVKAYRGLRWFRSGLPFRPWLLRIVANEAHNQRRGTARRSATELRAGMTPDSEPSVELAVLRGAERVQLLQAVNECPHDDRLVITCRYLLELSVEETAVVVGVAEGTIKSRLARALARLRSRMESADV